MKVLITHVPAGSGHEKAAEALKQAFQERYPSWNVSVMNALDGADLFYRTLFTEGYLQVIEKVSFLWGFLYYLTDCRYAYRFFQWNHRVSNHWHGKKLESIFLKEQPDVIVGTHFFPMEVAGALKTAGKLRARLVTVLTDYLPHTLWMAQGVDHYVVASQKAQEILVQRGVPIQSIRILGIPIHSKFQQPTVREELRATLGIAAHHLTVLVACGGEGMGPVVQWVKAFASVKAPLQILVLAGKNKALQEALEALRSDFPHPMKVYGFVDNMHELMEVSDLILTKPGGLSCSEALAKGKPLLLMHPIPGQESRNARFLTEFGAARLVPDSKQLAPLIMQLLQNPKELEGLRQKARGVSFPDASARIVEMVAG